MCCVTQSKPNTVKTHKEEKGKAKARAMAAEARAMAAEASLAVGEGALVAGASRPVHTMAASREPALPFIWAVFGDVLNFIKEQKQKQKRR